MSTTKENVINAVRDGRAEVSKGLDRLASELEDTASRIRKLEDEYLDNQTWERQSATIIAREVGSLLRQPLGQNAQELLLQAIASLSYDQGALQALRLTEEEIAEDAR